MNLDLSNLSLINHESVSVLVDQLLIYPNGKFDININKHVLSQVLVDFLSDNQIVAFARAMQIMTQLVPLPAGVWESRIADYIKRFRFGVDTPIDLPSTSQAIIEELSLNRLRLLSELTPTETNIIQGLSSQQRSVFANFNPEGIDVLSRIVHLPQEQRSFIFRLTEEERGLFSSLGQQQISLLVSLPVEQRDLILDMNLQQRNIIRNVIQLQDRNQQLNLLEGFGDLNLERLGLLHSIVELDLDSITALRDLIGEQIEELRRLIEDSQDIIARIGNLSQRDRDSFLGLNEEEMDMFRYLNEQDRHEIAQFGLQIQEEREQISLMEVLKVVNTFSEEEVDLVLSLQQKEIEVLIDEMSSSDMYMIAKLSQQGRAHIMKVENLGQEEEAALLQLNPEERRLLTRVYSLHPSGLSLMDRIGPVKVGMVLNVARQRENGTEHLNLIQKALLKKINNLSPKERDKIIALTKEELEIVDRIFQSNVRHILLNLSKEGRVVLTRIADLNQEQIDIVLGLSRDGIVVLARNSNLRPEVINSLGMLDKIKGQLLINLSLEERDYIQNVGRVGIERLSHMFTQGDVSVIMNLILEEQGLLQKLVILSEEERAQLQNLSPDEASLIRTFDQDTLNLFSMLNQEEVDKLAQVFMWNIEEEFAFNIFKQSDDLITNNEIINNLSSIFSKFMQFTADHVRKLYVTYCKFFASLLIARRLDGNQLFDGYIANIIEDNIISRNLESLSSSSFYFYLLQFSMISRFKDSYLSSLISKISDDQDIIKDLVRGYDFSIGENLIFFKWMLLQSVKPDMEKLYQIVRNALFDYSLDLQTTALSKITFSTEGLLSQALIRQFVDENYVMAISIFLTHKESSSSLNRDTLVAEWLVTVLTTDDLFRIMNTPVTQNLLDDNDLTNAQSILSDQKFLNPNLLECSLYYNRGNPLPLLRACS